MADRTQVLDMVEASPGKFVFGRVVHPPFQDRLIPDADTFAWDDLGQRAPIGVVWHTMVGTLWGTDTYFRTGAPGLTDYGVGGATDGPRWDGVILRWNDPRGRRAGWANGGSDGLEGDGPLFVRTRGVNAINRDLVSIERSDGGDPYNAVVSAKQAGAIVRLTAYWFDQAKVAWGRFPVNDLVGAIVTHLLHLEFATKGCPHSPVVDRVEELQGRVRAILKAAQTFAEGVPAKVPPVGPVVVDHGHWPGGYTEARLAERFGTLRAQGVDGTVKPARFDPKGPISNAWAARGATEKRTVAELPPPSLSIDIAPGKPGDPVARIVLFDGRGSDNWLLFRPTPDVAFRWVDQPRAA